MEVIPVIVAELATIVPELYGQATEGIEEFGHSAGGRKLTSLEQIGRLHHRLAIHEGKVGLVGL